MIMNKYQENVSVMKSSVLKTSLVVYGDNKLTSCPEGSPYTNCYFPTIWLTRNQADYAAVVNISRSFVVKWILNFIVPAVKTSQSIRRTMLDPLARRAEGFPVCLTRLPADSVISRCVLPTWEAVD